MKPRNTEKEMKLKKIMKNPFHDSRKIVKCPNCHFKTEFFYSWSDFDVETKHVEQGEVECPNCHNVLFAKAYWK